MITIKAIEDYMAEYGYGWQQAYWELNGCPEGDEWESNRGPEHVELREQVRELIDARIKWRDRFASLWASVCVFPDTCREKQYPITNQIYREWYDEINKEYTEQQEDDQ